MSKPLAVYLEDHLAGAVQAIELIESIHKQHLHDELGKFTENLLREVQSDRQVLLRLAESIGTGSSTVKEATAWISEKLTLIKLRHEANSGLGTLEALEFLELGIHGKSSLWRALQVIATANPGLDSIDFKSLIDRAETQKAQVEEFRLKWAILALSSEPNVSSS